MDFELNDDERALQEGMRAFLNGRHPLSVARANEDTGSAVDRFMWSALAEMGVFRMRVDGFGMIEAVLAFEELGRALVNGPLVATHLAAGSSFGARDGKSVVGMVEETEPFIVVEHFDSLDEVIVFREYGIYLVDPAEMRVVRSEQPLDALTPVARVIELPDGERIGESDGAAEHYRNGMVLTAAYQLGMCLATIDLARDYALQREQFGRPIGSFQAVKHMLADMLTKAEVTRAAVYAAAVNIDCRGDVAGDDDAALMQKARAAKILAGDSAVFCGKTCIQVHGGMGFTWEVDAQRYWKRACVLDTHFGNSDHHAAEYAAAL
jgi:alkylation response protein AidB-like acyl-CoA dehydrogenase